MTAPELEALLEDGSTYQLTDLDGQPIRLDRPARQGRVAQLLGVVVPAVPAGDADPARARREVPRPRPRDRRHQRPGDDAGRRHRVRRPLRARLHDRLRWLRAHPPDLPGVRPADPVLHRHERRHRARRQRPGRRGRRERPDRIDARRPCPRTPAFRARRLRPARTGSGRGRARGGRPAAPTRATAR